MSSTNHTEFTHVDPRFVGVLPRGTVVVDVETTGLNPFEHSMIEIGMIDWEGRVFEAVFRPRVGASVDMESLQVSGTTLDELETRPLSHSEAVREAALFLGRASWVIAGQNVHFDLGFLRHAFEGLPPHMRPRLSSRTLDIHSIAMAIFGRSLNSGEIQAMTGIEQESDCHRAIGGAEWEFAALRSLLQRCSTASSGAEKGGAR